ncbi:uncharacterized protein [Arachis hypogaea]|uniref:uncharacterized protein n=1 Tax=Arachis hypogaea TaxID=3818 RepID=UPI003B222E98
MTPSLGSPPLRRRSFQSRCRHSRFTVKEASAAAIDCHWGTTAVPLVAGITDWREGGCLSYCCCFVLLSSILQLYQQKTGNGFWQRISADSCFTSWSWSMCWNNCHVRNLSNGYGSRQDNCTGSIVGLNFAVYESLKDWLVKSNPFGLVQDSELSVTTRVACGAALGTVGQTVAYPL